MNDTERTLLIAERQAKALERIADHITRPPKSPKNEPPQPQVVFYCSPKICPDKTHYEPTANPPNPPTDAVAALAEALGKQGIGHYRGWDGCHPSSHMGLGPSTGDPSDHSEDAKSILAALPEGWYLTHTEPTRELRK